MIFLFFFFKVVISIKGGDICERTLNTKPYTNVNLTTAITAVITEETVSLPSALKPHDHTRLNHNENNE